MNELGTVSQALLEYINAHFGYVSWFRMIHDVERRTGEKHTGHWYFRRLVALALEGRIDSLVHWTGDSVVIKFRRLQETGGR